MGRMLLRGAAATVGTAATLHGGLQIGASGITGNWTGDPAVTAVEVAKIAAALMLIILSARLADQVFERPGDKESGHGPVISRGIGLLLIGNGAMTSTVGSLMIHGGATVFGMTIPTGTVEATIFGTTMATAGLCFWIAGCAGLAHASDGTRSVRASTAWP